MAEKTKQGGARPHVQQPTNPYRPCGVCTRCTTGAGRDRDPAASDCWADYLDRAMLDLRAARQPA